MKNEVAIITAFFDIGRDKFTVYPRSNDIYFSYFEKWAGIKNKLIIFCASEYIEKIKMIRESKGIPQNMTVIVAIDDITEIEPEIFGKMISVEKDSSFSEFRFYKKACSNIASYDYVMLLKYYFMYYANVLHLVDEYENIAWVDFGFNHGDAYYINPSEFEFLWNWEFKNNIELFALSNPNEMSLIDSLQFQEDCIQGTVVGCKKMFLSELWNWIREAMISLLNCGCIDDDQHLLLMMYKQHKENCHVTVCDWFMQFELTSDVNFTVKKRNNRGIKKNNKQINDWMERNTKRIHQYYGE